VIPRALLFAAWAVVGTVASYGLPYAFSPFGLAILGVSLLVALALPQAAHSRMPEILGLLAGPGVFCFVVAVSGVDDPAPWAVAGTLIVSAALVAYTLTGRARCARGA
jgi:hypothetical protein